MIKYGNDPNSKSEDKDSNATAKLAMVMMMMTVTMIMIDLLRTLPRRPQLETVVSSAS